MALQSIKRSTSNESRNIVKKSTKGWNLKEQAKYLEFNYEKWLTKKLNRITPKSKKVIHNKSFM